MGQDYLGIREYRPGDTLRQVHWPSSARRGSLMVREYEQERPQRLALVIDTSADAGDADTPLDACCAAAASVALLAIGRGQPVHVSAGRDGSLDRLEDPGPSELLEWLAYLRGGGRVPLEAAAQEARASMGPAGAAVLVFPTWRWNGPEAVARSLAELDGPARRSIAVVIDAASFPRERELRASEGSARGAHDVPTLSPAEADELVSTLVGRAAAAYRVSGDRDLARCLGEPIGAKG
jgi:uncharacterized protein (DUF58 family)